MDRPLNGARFALAIALWLAARTATAQVPERSPAPPSPAPASSPAVRASRVPGEEVPASYSRIRAALRGRAVPPAAPLRFRFGSLDRPAWPAIQVREISATPAGLGCWIEGEPRPVRAGDTVRGARVVRISPGELTLELAGERRRFTPPRVFPNIVIKAIRYFEGDLVALVQGERGPVVAGVTVQDARVVRIERDGVTLTFGGETRKLAPPRVREPFPEVVFSGIVTMRGAPVVFVRDRSTPYRAGDRVDGALIVEIARNLVTLEFEGQRRTVPVR